MSTLPIYYHFYFLQYVFDTLPEISEILLSRHFFATAGQIHTAERRHQIKHPLTPESSRCLSSTFLRAAFSSYGVVWSDANGQQTTMET